MNAEIKELYELIDYYGIPADTESADTESAGSESADNKQLGSADPLTAGPELRHETTTDNSPDRDHRAATPPRAPP